MFTGLIQRVGTITEVKNVHGNRIFSVQTASDNTDPFKLGESVAMDGVCLTIKEVFDFGFRVEAVKATLSCTTLRRFQPGQRVNLERALKLGDRLGGHIVLGHVDGVGVVKNLAHELKNVTLEIIISPALLSYISLKASVCVNGVSLTVREVGAISFKVSLIEYTLNNTNLAQLQAKDEVNIEVDVLARYVETVLKSSKGKKNFVYLQDKGIL